MTRAGTVQKAAREAALEHPGGYAGKLLRVDLTSGRSRKVDWSPEEMRTYIGGVGLARGYLNCPELNAEKFIPHPFRDRPEARLYKTGDLARCR
ncbi:MAG: hypothetical protein AAB285_00990, partial [candidate division NC10 bacterium]